MKINLIFISLIFYNLISAQSSNSEDDFIKSAKQLISTYTDESFVKILHGIKTSTKGISECYFLKKDYLNELGYSESDRFTLVELNISTDYCNFNRRCRIKKGFYYKIQYGKVNITTSTINICFNNKMKVLYKPDLNNIYNGFKKFQKYSDLTVNEIKKVSNDLSRNSHMRIYSVTWIYDLRLEKLYCQIERINYLRKNDIEIQKIDFDNYRLIEE